MRWGIVACFMFVAVPASVASETQNRFGIDSRQAAALIESIDRERQLRIPMRDGVGLNADILFPPGPRRDLPAILIRTPYAFSTEIRSFAGPLSRWLDSGYAVVLSHERGRYWSEGAYTFLSRAGEDGYDTVDWIIRQPWSNGRVGTIGCSSSAENQMGLAATAHPGHAAMIPMSPNAGIGVIGSHHEQGSWFRGGVNQFWLEWYYSSGSRVWPSFPTDLSREERILIEDYFRVAPNLPPRNLARAAWHLPIQDMMRAAGGLPSDFEEFIRRKPADPAWAEVSFGNEGDRFGTPSIWVLSWYDYAVAPDIAFFNWQRDNARSRRARDNQFLVIGPTTHCGQGFETANTVVGERDLGDARFDYFGVFDAWFDQWLKGKSNDVSQRPRVALYTIGKGWQGYDEFPPRGAQRTAWYLASDGNANSLAGDGRLAKTVPEERGEDSYIYDPRHPVPSHGGQGCCHGDELNGGSYDQTGIQLRHDVLVYTSEPFDEAVEITGFIESILYVSSDVRDTDFAIKLTQLLPDGRAFNLADSIQRARYREGYDQEVFMSEGEVYEIQLPSMATSVLLDEGHRLRIEVSSSNFPRYLRNLNTGGKNYDENEGLAAHNVLHHSPDYPSRLVLPMVRTPD